MRQYLAIFEMHVTSIHRRLFLIFSFLLLANIADLYLDKNFNLTFKIFSTPDFHISFYFFFVKFNLLMLSTYLIKKDIKTGYFSHIFRNRPVHNIKMHLFYYFATILIILATIFFILNFFYQYVFDIQTIPNSSLLYIMFGSFIFSLTNSKIEAISALFLLLQGGHFESIFEQIFTNLFLFFYSYKLVLRYFKHYQK